MKACVICGTGTGSNKKTVCPECEHTKEYADFYKERKAGYQKKYLSKRSQLDGIDSDKAADAILALIDGKTKGKELERKLADKLETVIDDDTKVYEPMQNNLAFEFAESEDKPLVIYNVYVPYLNADINLHFRNIDKVFDWLKQRFLDTGCISDVEIKVVNVI